MRRGLALLLALAVAAGAAIGVTGCSRKVRVESGTRYVCTYGESLGADVKQLDVPSGEAGDYVVRTKRITCTRHKQAEDLYMKAQAAIKAGNLKQARADLEATLKLDPDFKRGKEQLDQIAKGKTPLPDLTPAPAANAGTTPPGGASGTPPASGGASEGPTAGGSSPMMEAYLDIVPDSIGGFTAEKLSAEDLSLTRAYVPKEKSRYDQLVIMVQQYGSAGSAEAAVASDIKNAYSASGANVTVSGLKGYFGVNGQGFAVLSLVNGNVLVNIELHATKVKARELRPDLEQIAETILD